MHSDTSSNRVCGILEYHKPAGGFLRKPDKSLIPQSDDSYVSPQMIREFSLPAGCRIDGVSVRQSRGYRLEHIDKIGGLTPDQFISRVRFEQLQAVNPETRFHLGDHGNVSMKAMDLIAPLGMGSRGLIVAQPRTGKTMLLEALAESVRKEHPALRIIVLLIDERPEEVTHFQRQVDAEVFASSSDQSLEAHIRLTELVLAHARIELECGHDIVFLVDSLTRMSRAFNQVKTGTGRTLSGGMDARAMEIPRRFFGLARNVEHGGSVTVVATVLTQTGSRMDEIIFQEFKGTGNSEIVLSRELADARIFPAIDIMASGTRKEELLVSSDELTRIHTLRRKLAAQSPQDAMMALLTQIESEQDDAPSRTVKTH